MNLILGFLVCYTFIGVVFIMWTHFSMAVNPYSTTGLEGKEKKELYLFFLPAGIICWTLEWLIDLNASRDQRKRELKYEKERDSFNQSRRLK
jgi:hypothetical protein